MPDATMLKSAESIRAAADALGAAADTLRDRRRADFVDGKISADQAFRSVSEETMLREQATKLFVKANSFVVKNATGAQDDLMQAIAAASSRIAQIANFRQALQVFAGLITLAGAIVSGQPKAIAGAIEGLKESTG